MTSGEIDARTRPRQSSLCPPRILPSFRLTAKGPLSTMRFWRTTSMSSLVSHANCRPSCEPNFGKKQFPAPPRRRCQNVTRFEGRTLVVHSFVGLLRRSRPLVSPPARRLGWPAWRQELDATAPQPLYVGRYGTLPAVLHAIFLRQRSPPQNPPQWAPEEPEPLGMRSSRDLKSWLISIDCPSCTELPLHKQQVHLRCLPASTSACEPLGMHV